MIHFTRYAIESVFSLALFINSLLFIPQIVKIIRDRSARHVSLLTFLGLFLIQFTIVLHGFVKHDPLLIIGYIISMITCGVVVVLIFLYSTRFSDSSINCIIYLKKVFDLLPCNIYVKDKEGKFLFSNRGNTESFIIKPLSSLIGKTDYDIFTKEEADQLRSIDIEVWRTGQGKIVEEFSTIRGERHLYLSHKIPFYNEDNEIIGILGASFDITHIKEKELDQLDMLENIIAVMPGNVYWMDKNLMYLGCNKNQAKISGFSSRKEIVGKTNTKIGGFLISEALDEINKKVIREGKTITAEEPAILPDGSKGIFLSNKVPILNRNKEVVGLVGISIDITNRKKMEISLKQAKEKAEEFNELKSQFIQNMEHDLRTPASGIIQTLSVLCSKEQNSEKRKILQLSLGAGEELMTLLNRIVDFTNRNYSNPVLNQPIKLSTIFESVRCVNAPGGKIKNLNFYYKISPNIPTVVLCDEYRLERILLNLVGNAIKFTKKGEVLFEAKLAKQEGRNLLIELIVKDTGIGIPENKRHVIFERFVRLDASNRGIYKGTGLGLTHVREYVRDLDGEFKPVDSAPGYGTTFSILIPMKASLDQQMELESTTATKEPVEETKSIPKPAAKDKQQETEIPLPAAALPLSKGKKCCDILLVEDSPVAQLMTKSVLLGLGCDLDIAGTAEDALEMINQKKYDLIFGDIGLPGMDGIEMVRHIRYEERKRDLAQTPIVGQSAQADAKNKKACISAGMQDLIGKPLTTKVVSEILKNYVQPYSQAHPTPPPLVTRSIHNKHVINRDFLKELFKDEASVKEIIGMMKKQTPGDIAEFKKAHDARNWKDLLFLTHKLRGGFIYLATMRLDEAFGHLEDYLNEKTEPNAQEVELMCNTILIEADAVLKEVNKL